MAHLKQDEWPKDDEPTTSEQEGDAFKRERPTPQARASGRLTDDMNQATRESVINDVESEHG